MQGEVQGEGCRQHGRVGGGTRRLEVFTLSLHPERWDEFRAMRPWYGARRLAPDNLNQAGLDLEAFPSRYSFEEITMNRSIVVSVLALAAACEGKKAASADSTPAAAPAAAAPAAAAPAAPAATASVKIVSPAKGATTGSDVDVVLTKANVTIAKADGQQVSGIGHFHLFLDTVPSADGQPIPPNSKNTVHIGTGDSTYTFKGLKPGPHQLIAVLGYGNHVPMSSMRDTVTFTVKP